MLFVVPAVFILGAWVRGTRPGEEPIVDGLALVCALGFVPALIIGVDSGDVLAKAAAYAFAVISTSCLAMSLRKRPGRGGGGEDPEPGAPVPEGPDGMPFDWDDFERSFWQDVQRRERPRVPVA
jgi:hypothetical protein